MSKAFWNPAAWLEQSGGLVRGRVDGAVEHHRPDVGREGLRVHRADLGSVGVADVGELLIAQRGAQNVEILCHVTGSDRAEERGTVYLSGAAGPLDTVAHALLDPRVRLRDLLRGAEPIVGGPVGVALRIRTARDRRRRRSGPSRVEADQVEAFPQILGIAGGDDLPELGGTADPGAAEVEDGGPDAVAGGRRPEYGDLHLLAVGLVVFHGHRQMAALHVRAAQHLLGVIVRAELGARAPLELLAVVLLEPGRYRGRAGRRWSGRRGRGTG